MVSYSPDEIGDWAVTYYLELKDLWGVSYSPDKAWAAKRQIEDFISYLKVNCK